MSFYHLDPACYQELLSILNNQHFTNQGGKEQDLSFLYKDWWLQDTAVIDNIFRRKGLWEIHLVFAHYLRPYQLIMRKIKSTYCRKKAEQQAVFMRRLAAKDQRGTLGVKLEDFLVCDN